MPGLLDSEPIPPAAAFSASDGSYPANDAPPPLALAVVTTRPDFVRAGSASPAASPTKELLAMLLGSAPISQSAPGALLASPSAASSTTLDMFRAASGSSTSATETSQNHPLEDALDSLSLYARYAAAPNKPVSPAPSKGTWTPPWRDMDLEDKATEAARIISCGHEEGEGLCWACFSEQRQEGFSWSDIPDALSSEARTGFLSDGEEEHEHEHTTPIAAPGILRPASITPELLPYHPEEPLPSPDYEQSGHIYRPPTMPRARVHARQGSSLSTAAASPDPGLGHLNKKQKIRFNPIVKCSGTWLKAEYKRGVVPSFFGGHDIVEDEDEDWEIAPSTEETDQTEDVEGEPSESDSEWENWELPLHGSSALGASSQRQWGGNGLLDVLVAESVGLSPDQQIPVSGDLS